MGRVWLHWLILYVCGVWGRGAKEVSCIKVCLVFIVFSPFFNPSGALWPFATCGLFLLAQESSTRWIWSIWQEWYLIRMDIITQTVLWARIRTLPWLMVWAFSVGVSVLLGSYSTYAVLCKYLDLLWYPYIPAAWIWVTTNIREVFLVCFPVISSTRKSVWCLLSTQYNVWKNELE